MTWQNTYNLVGLQYPRSILGYAGESLVIGRALICGYNLFFKAWRDSKYDAVLDSQGILFRIEVKQTSNGSDFSVTSGGRTGAQINRNAGTREVVLSTADCDFLIGVHSMNGECWIVPTELIEILGSKVLSTNLLTVFKEKWSVFHALPPVVSQLVTISDIRLGFRSKSIADLQQIYTALGAPIAPPVAAPFSVRFSPTSRKRNLANIQEWYVAMIWLELYKLLP